MGMGKYEREEENREWERLRRQRRGGRRITEAIVTGALGAVTIGQAYVEPEQSGANTQGNWADSSAQDQGTDNARTQRGATRYKGRRSGDSSRQE